MKKRCKRRVRPATEPCMVTLYTIPEINLFERMAISHLRTGLADYENCYRVLADCHGMLAIAQHRFRDDRIKPVIDLGHVAMMNVYDRMRRVGKVGATADELSALVLMIDFAEDYWKRRPKSDLDFAMAALRNVREKQMAKAQDERRAA